MKAIEWAAFVRDSFRRAGRLLIWLVAVIVLLAADRAAAQNCGNTSTGMTPINDLGPGFYRGLQGGLYPGGSNVRPSLHTTAGLSLADQIRPLDIDGSPDSISGKIVFLAIGMSHTSDEFHQFQLMVDTLQQKNPFLVAVNGAKGGWDIDEIVDSTARYWRIVTDTLAELGLSEQQVQAIWFKQAEEFPGLDGGDTTFLPYTTLLKEKFILALNIIHEKFPNALLCYTASRIYAGYANVRVNPEPFAYYVGWTVKLLLEDQIDGNPLLAYDGPSPKAPWLSWGAYLWADGLNARSDGLTWICPDDFKEDGTHPSDPVGRIKVAEQMMEFFTSDETAAPWFLMGRPPVVSDIPDQSITLGERFQAISVDNYVVDPDDPDSAITWTWSGNVDLQIRWDPVRRRIRVRTPLGWTGSETVFFTATDPDGLSDSDPVKLAVIPVNRTGDRPGNDEDKSAPVTTWRGIHPNPFNPSTVFEFELEKPAFIELQVFDLLGREVSVLMKEWRGSGKHSVRWDAGNASGGVYFYRFSTGDLAATGKLLLIR